MVFLQRPMSVTLLVVVVAVLVVPRLMKRFTRKEVTALT
jgi:putative tricarboxylic transport membrane protein